MLLIGIAISFSILLLEMFSNNMSVRLVRHTCEEIRNETQRMAYRILTLVKNDKQNFILLKNTPTVSFLPIETTKRFNKTLSN